MSNEAHVDSLVRARVVWEAFAQQRALRFESSTAYPADPFSIEGRIEGIDMTFTTRRRRKRGFETLVRATARHAMLGRVVVRTTTWLDRFERVFREPPKIGDDALDAELTTEATSAALHRTILDDITVTALRVLAKRPLVSLAYENGSIAIRWGGVEEGSDVLEATTKLATHLAVVGSELSPYR